MNTLPAFDLHSPASVAGAVELKAKYGADAKILGGGTDLIVSMKHGLFSPGHLVGLGDIGELKAVTMTADGTIRIGAMCTLDAVTRDPLIGKHLAALRDAVRGIASPQIRNRASVGGNLCINTRCFYYDHSEFWRGALCGCLRLGLDASQANLVCHAGPGLGMCTAVFYSDLAPLLIALGARVEIAGPAGARVTPLAKLYTTDGGAHLTFRDDEFMTAVLVPKPGGNVRFRQMKFSYRGAVDFPVANVGARMEFDGSGACTGVDLVVGAVQTCPSAVSGLGEILVGRVPDAAAIAEAVEVASGGISPFPNAYESVGYRKKIVGVLVRRCLGALAEEARGG